MTTLDIYEANILNICCEIEETCANIYWFFSRLYKDNTEVSEMWSKTAREEENHAEQFKLACRLRGAGINSLKSDLYKAKTILKKVQSIYEGIQNSSPSLKEALRFSIKMEVSLCEYHMSAIANFEDKEIESLFHSMMNNDKGHVLMLENAYKATV